MKWLEWLLNKLDNGGVSVTVKTCEEHKKELDQWKSDFNKAIEIGNKLKEEIEKLQQELKKEKELNQQEEYWNSKRPKKLVTWKARNDVNMDVRCFFQVDGTLPKFTGTNDEIVSDVLANVITNIRYVSEKKEHWKYAYETLKDKYGDCEDGAILMAGMILNSNVPYWRIRLNKGFVKFQDGKKGYHCFLTYLAEKDNEWKIVDWCYWPEESTDLKRSWKDAEKYFEPDASWNSEFAFVGLNKE